MPLGCLVFTSPSDRMGWDPKQVVLCLSPFAWARRRGSAPNYPQFPKQGLLLGGAGATLSLGYDLIPLPVGSRVSLHTQDRLSSEDQLCRPLCYCTIRPCSFQKSSRALSQCVGLWCSSLHVWGRPSSRASKTHPLGSKRSSSAPWTWSCGRTCWVEPQPGHYRSELGLPKWCASGGEALPAFRPSPIPSGWAPQIPLQFLRSQVRGVLL